MKRQDIYDAIGHERDRQARLWSASHAWGEGDCSSPTLPPIVKSAVLAEECVTEVDFRVPECLELGSKGTRRAALCHVQPEIAFSGNSANMQFLLPKGSYATVVLREYIKGHEYSRDSAQRVTAEE